MNKSYILLLYLFLFGIFLPCELPGQYIDVENAMLEAKKLQHNVLIVRFPVNGPKIRYLQNRIKTTENEKARKNLTKELAAAEELNKIRFTALYSSLKKSYTFSPFLIMPDSNYNLFLKGENKVFLNEYGKKDPSLLCKNNDYFLLITGENQDQYVLVNKDLQKLDKPFPHRATVFMSGLTRVFNRRKYYTKQIEWINKKLFNLL
jgi:hypothetical protein